MITKHTHSVTIVPGFTLTGTVNTSTPDDMTVNIDGIEDEAFTAEQYREYFAAATSALDEHFDALIPCQGVDSPIEGMTVVVDNDSIAVTLVGEGDGLMLAQAPMADAVIDASVQRAIAA